MTASEAHNRLSMPIAKDVIEKRLTSDGTLLPYGYEQIEEVTPTCSRRSKVPMRY